MISDESKDESDDDEKIKDNNTNENVFPALFPSQNKKLFNNLGTGLFNNNTSLFQTNPSSSVSKNEHSTLFKTDPVNTSSIFKNGDNKNILFKMTNENSLPLISNQTTTILNKENIEFSTTKSDCFDLNKSPSAIKLLDTTAKNETILNENKANNNPFLISN